MSVISTWPTFYNSDVLLSKFRKFILKFHRFSTAFPKCNVELLQNYSILSRIIFSKFCNFPPIFLKAYLTSILEISSNYTMK